MDSLGLVVLSTLLTRQLFPSLSLSRCLSLFLLERQEVVFFFGLLVCFPCCQSIVTLRKLLSLVNGTSARVDTDWQLKHCKESQNLCVRVQTNTVLLEITG